MGSDETWRDRSAYLYGLALDDPEWAWEFLRRNRRFRAATPRPPATAVAAGTPLAAADGALEEWGLHFRARPGRARSPRPRRLAAGLAG